MTQIHDRLVRGEAPGTIEADFVARYGPQIRADAEHSPLRWISLGLVVTALAAALGLALVLRRWTRRPPGAPVPKTAPPRTSTLDRDAWDERLDDELRAMD